MTLFCSKEYQAFRVYPIPETLSIAAGDSSFIALKVELPFDYYIYGNPKGPGIGKPTVVAIKPIQGISLHSPQYLEPEKYYSMADANYTWIYTHETVVFIPFTVEENARLGKRTIGISFDALMCSKSECIIKKFDIPYQIEIVPMSSRSTKQNDSLLELFTRSRSPEVQSDQLTVGEKRGTSSQLSDITFEPRTLDRSINGIVQAILFGLLAGLILNVMPCVLPVVSLKVMNFVQHAGKSKKELRILGVLFSLGILSSFAILAMLAAFFGYSWGGLFQHRLFIIFMAAIVFALALSLFDVYTVNIPRFAGAAAKDRKNPYADAFMKGLLATLLATPCSGPFLGGTLAWALKESPLVIIVIVMSVGLGMALPYLVLTMNQKLISFIPKPGEWMQIFERIMGFFLIFTVVYLVGILEKDFIMPTIAFLCFIALGLWQFGRYGALYQKRATRIVSFALLLFIIMGGYYLSYNKLYVPVGSHTIERDVFSPERLLANKKSGKISMVVFTAAWCPNCKVVERLSLETAAVMNRIKLQEIDLMIADITQPNPPANDLLRAIGGRSIPYLALFPAGSAFNRPICLRDIYSESDVLRAITMAAAQ